MLEQLALLDKSLDPSLAGTLAGLALAASIFCYGVNQFSGKSLKLIGDGFLHAFLLLLLSVVVDALGFPLVEKLIEGFTDNTLTDNLPLQGANVSSEYFLFGLGLWVLMATGLKLAFRREIPLKGLLIPWPVEGSDLESD